MQLVAFEITDHPPAKVELMQVAAAVVQVVDGPETARFVRRDAVRGFTRCGCSPIPDTRCARRLSPV